MEIISGRQSPKANIDDKEAIMEVFEALNKEEQQQGSKPEVAHVKNNEESSNKDDAATTGRMLELMQSTEEALYSPVLSRAHAVAKELMSMDDEAARWDLISEVWLEMLFYIAPRCGGAFHYEHLITGGEFISHVLLLMHNLGPFMPMFNGHVNSLVDMEGNLIIIIHTYVTLLLCNNAWKNFPISAACSEGRALAMVDSLGQPKHPRLSIYFLIPT
jgi:hypothetical protein